MANRYWVGGTDTWNAAVSSKWAATSGGAGGQSVPTAADDVFFDGASGAVTVTLTSQSCRSINFTGFTGTFVHPAAVQLSVGDGTAGAGNIAIKVVAGMTYTVGNTSTSLLAMYSTSGTQQTIETGGKTMPTTTISSTAIGSSYLLSDAFTCIGAFTHSAGTFDTANYSMTASLFSYGNATARTLTLGSSAITLTGTGGFAGTAVGNLTVTANTAVVTITAASPAFVLAGTFNWNGLSFVLNGGGTIGGNGGTSATVADFTITGTASQVVAWPMQHNLTCTGTFTVTGHSEVNRVLINSITTGTTRTITAATTSLTNVDFMDITGAGAGSWTVTSGVVGDRQGNSGITFTTPATQTRDSTSGQAWSVAARWTSRVPLPQDNVIINGSSGNISATDVLCLGKNIDFTGYTGTLTHTSTNGTNNIVMFGSLTLASGMSYGASVNTWYMEFRGRGTHTITSNGKTLPTFNSNGNYYIYAPGGSYTLADALSMNTVLGVGNCGFSVVNGTFDSAGYNITVGKFLSTGTGTRAVTLGSSVVTIYCSTTATVLAFSTTGMTFSGSSAKFTISTATFNTRTFDLQTKTIDTLNYTVANSPGGLTSTSSCTINTLNMGSGRLFTVTAGTTLTTFGGTLSGTNNGYVYMAGDSAGAYIPDSAATSIPNDIDVRVRVALDNVAYGGGMRIAAKYGAAGQRSWRFYISTGNPIFETTNDGTNTAVSATSTQTLAAAGLSSGTTYWLRVARDKAAGTVKFYYAPDSTTVPSGAGWTQIGSTLSGLSTTTIFDSNTITVVGGETSGTNSNPGKYYRMQVCSNLADDGSAIQADINLATKPFGADTFTESSSNAATVTMANSGIYGDGRLQIQSSSTTKAYLSKPYCGAITTSDYLAIKDMSVTQPLSFFAGANSVDKTGNNGIDFTNSTYKHVQSTALGNVVGTSTTVTYPTATTVGNLLIAYFLSSNSQGTYTPPAGWTEAESSSSTAIVYIYYKIADGTETSVTFSQTTSRTLSAALVEYTGFSGAPTLDVTDSNGTGSSVTSLSTTATTGPTNTAQPALALAMLGNGSTLGATVSLSNSFVEDRTLTNAATQYKGAAKELTTTAAVDTTFTWTTARANTAMALVVFKNAAATGNLGSFFEVF